MLEEISLLEETNEFLRFRVENLKISKIVTYLVDHGQYGDINLVELDLLLYTIEKITPKNEKLNEIAKLISDCINEQYFLDAEWNYQDFYSKISVIKDIINMDKKISGEFISEKGKFQSDYNIELD